VQSRRGAGNAGLALHRRALIITDVCEMGSSRSVHGSAALDESDEGQHTGSISAADGNDQYSE
jgi:hypothetical protein